MQRHTRSIIAAAAVAARSARHASIARLTHAAIRSCAVRRFSAAASPPPPPPSSSSNNSSANPHARPQAPQTPAATPTPPSPAAPFSLHAPSSSGSGSAASSSKGGWSATVVPAGSFMNESQIESALRAQIARVRAAAAILEREAAEAEASGLPPPKTSLPPRAQDPTGTPYPSPPRIPRSLLEQLSPGARTLYEREAKEAEEARLALQNAWHEAASWRDGGWKTARFWGPRRRRALMWFNFGWGACLMSLIVLWRQEWGPDAGMYQLRREDEQREAAILAGRDPRTLGLPERDAHGHVMSASSAAVRWSKADDPPRAPRSMSPSAMAFAPKVAKAHNQGAAMMDDSKTSGHYPVKPKPQQT